MEIDVVCGSEVDPRTALTLEHDGKAFYFCSEECLEAFEDDPEEFKELAESLDPRA